MTTYRNQMIPAHGKDRFELATVSHADDVVAFRWHSVGIHSSSGASHRYMNVHGVSVDARFVWSMIAAIHEAPSRAVLADGSEVWCTAVWLEDGSRELRAGADRHGRTLARRSAQEAWDNKTGVSEAVA